MKKKVREQWSDPDRVTFQESIKVERDVSEKKYSKIKANLESVKCTNKTCTNTKDIFDEESEIKSPYSFAKISSMPKDILFFRSYNSWCCLEYKSEVMRAYYQSIKAEFPNLQDKDGHRQENL